MNNKAIVIGGDHHNSLGVIRSLGRVGIKPYVIIVSSSKKSFVLKSKYIKQGWMIKESKQIVDFLLEKFGEEQEKPIIITCADGLASEIDMNRDKLSEKFYVMCSTLSEGLITEYMDKHKMTDLAVKCGIKIPHSWTNIEEVTYPCFVKPLVSKNGSKKEITVKHNKEDLISYCNEIDGELIIQEFIDKDFEYQAIGCSLDGGKNIIIPGIAKIIRCSKVSNTGFLEYLPMEEFNFPYMEECKKFIKATGYSGLFSMEFIRDKNGNDYFLEINFRNDGNAICVTAAGVNLPYIWYLHNSCGDISSTNTTKVEKKLVMPEFNDFMFVRRKEITFKQWRKDVKRTDCFMEYDKKDKRPFYSKLFSIIFR